MGLKRDIVERQRELALDTLKAWEEKLKEDGADAKKFRRDPKWRKLNADCRQLKRRLNAIGETEEINAALAARGESSEGDAE